MTWTLHVRNVAAAAAALVIASASPAAPQATLAASSESGTPREAVARVAYAEAADQGDSGLAGVVQVILNRLASGEWGSSISDVLNAKGQFEPVMRAGGDWRRLPPVSPTKQARIDTIINLILDGRLPDPTNGARYFQNPSIVAARVRLGQAPASLIKFGMSRPTAVIGSHWFFRAIPQHALSIRTPYAETGPIFITSEGTRASRSTAAVEAGPALSAISDGSAPRKPSARLP